MRNEQTRNEERNICPEVIQQWALWQTGHARGIPQAKQAVWAQFTLGVGVGVGSSISTCFFEGMALSVMVHIWPTCLFPSKVTLQHVHVCPLKDTSMAPQICLSRGMPLGWVWSEWGLCMPWVSLPVISSRYQVSFPAVFWNGFFFFLIGRAIAINGGNEH